MFGLINAGHILKGDFGGFFCQHFGAGFAKAHGFAAALLHLAQKKQPDTNKNQPWQGPDDHTQQGCFPLFLWRGTDANFGILQPVHQFEIAWVIGDEGGLTLIATGGCNLLALNGDLFNLSLREQLRKFGIIHHRGFGGAGLLKTAKNGKNNQRNNNPNGNVFQKIWHKTLSLEKG